MAKIVISTGPTGIAAITAPPPMVSTLPDGRKHIRTIDGKPAIVIVEQAVWEEIVEPEVTRQEKTGALDADGKAVYRRVIARPEVRRRVEVKPAVVRLMTDEEYLAAQMRRGRLLPPGYSDAAVIDEADLPADLFAGDDRRGKLFRAAWRNIGGRIVVDMDAARALHLGRVRRVRNVALAKLDVEFSRAIASGDSGAPAVIEGVRQVLRDLPATFDLTAAKTPRDLAALWPADLPPPG